MYIVHRNRVILNKHFIVAYLLCAQNLSLLILLNTLLYKKFFLHCLCKKMYSANYRHFRELKREKKNLIFFSQQSTVLLNIEFARILAIFGLKKTKKATIILSFYVCLLKEPSVNL